MLSNAAKFTDRGHVRLRVSSSASTQQGFTRLRFEVSDTGIGIPADVQARLFMPFAQADASTTRRYGGTGLGLSIVRHFTEMMGGTVGLNSEPGRGSCFWAELAFKADDAAGEVAAATIRDATSTGLNGIRVMVVDDSDINLDVARRILQLAGANVALAADGEEALSMLGQHPDEFDVVLMDMQMPRLDSHEATRRIRAELGLKDLPIIALTAGALTSEQQKALESGVADFISKPFEPRDLIQRIRRQVQLSGGISRMAVDGSSTPSAGQPDESWPHIEGVDMPTVQSLFGSDITLYRSPLSRMLDEHLPSRLLDEHSLDALDHFSALKGELARVCEPALLETLQAHVEALRFAEAYGVLASLASLSEQHPSG